MYIMDAAAQVQGQSCLIAPPRGATVSSRPRHRQLYTPFSFHIDASLTL